MTSRPRSQDVRVRPARRADVPVLLDLWAKLLAFHRDIGETDMRLGPAVIADGREFFDEHIGKRNRLCLVAEESGTPIGFLVGTLRQRSPAFGGWRYGHVYDLYVQDPSRGRGAGAALVLEAFRWFRKHRARRVQLQVRARNTLGIDFWKRLGFSTLALTMERTI